MAYIVVVFLALAAIDLPPLLRRRQRREIISYALIYAGVFTLALLVAAGIKLPSPMAAVGRFMEEVLHLGYPGLGPS